LLGFDRRTHEAHARPQSNRSIGGRISNRIAHPQLASAFVEQVNGERFKGNQPADESRDLPQEVVEVEDAGDLAAEIEQRRDEFLARRLRLFVRLRIRPGFVLDMTRSRRDVFLPTGETPIILREIAEPPHHRDTE